jgi:hypothetical protein
MKAKGLVYFLCADAAMHPWLSRETGGAFEPFQGAKELGVSVSRRVTQG